MLLCLCRYWLDASNGTGKEMEMREVGRHRNGKHSVGKCNEPPVTTAVFFGFIN
jgi:hypothetical protein